MNAELVKLALEKVQSPQILVNLVSRRVRQFNSGAYGMRPLVTDVANLRGADIALREIIEDKMGFDMPELVKLTRPSEQNRKRPAGWGRPPAPKSSGTNG